MMYPSKIAVRDVCAWSQLIGARDGGVLAFGHNGRYHGFYEGGIDCWFSADGGHSWEFRAHAVVENPGENRIHIAVGRDVDENLLLICTGFNNLPPRPPLVFPGQGEPAGPGVVPRRHADTVDPVKAFRPEVELPRTPYTSIKDLQGPFVLRSVDEGKTWESVGRFSDASKDRRRVPFGKVIALESGVLGVSVYGEGSSMPPTNARLYISKDNGETWTQRSEILPEIGTETDILNLGEGRLLAAARNHPVDDLKLLFSGDFGHTWEYQGAVTLPGQHPAHLQLLTDGSILLTFGVRNPGYYGVAARRSTDGGRTWEPPLFLHEFGMGPVVRLDPTNVERFFTDGGYPSTLEIEPGKVLTSFYAREGQVPHRYYLGMLHWSLQEATSGSPVA